MSSQVVERHNKDIAELKNLMGLLATKKKQIDLCNAKNFEPHVFVGNDKDDVYGRYKKWSKAMKGYCNSKVQGFRKALDWAEAEEDVIDEGALSFMNWLPATEANQELYDMLWLGATEETHGIVETVPDKGFVAWRLLKLRYNPACGKFGLVRITAMFTQQPCKSIEEIPAATDRLEKALKHYEEASQHKMPNDL